MFAVRIAAITWRHNQVQLKGVTQTCLRGRSSGKEA
jgi:hypothetical protein